MTACTVLIISESTPYLADTLDEDRLSELWNSATEILHALNSKHHMVAQCAGALQDLRAKANSPYQSNSAGNATSLQPFPAATIGDTLPQTSEGADQGSYNNRWIAGEQNLGLLADFNNEENQGLHNQDNAFLPILQGLQGSFTEAGSDVLWAGFDQSWCWTPF